MAFSEALRLIIDADTRGAVRGIQQVGRATDKELGRSTKTIDAWSRGLTMAGATMVAVGGAALFGLGKAAIASEEANLSVVKLENTLANMPRLAGENSKSFIDLANSIQDKTAADADQIVAAEAMLGTFNLTGAEIRKITPLVVDYSRKFGVDMVSAAIQVGKALDGNVGALKRNGVSIDEVAFKTDRFGAVQKALADQVGGFAEAEGKTFAGSLQRLKNEMGDVAEGVGVGAVDAFSSMFGVVEGLTDRLNDLSPATQSTIGKIATFGSVGLVAAGGLSFMIGQTITAVQRFKDAGSAISGFTTKMGGLGRVAGVAAGAAGLAGLVIAVDQFEKAADRAEVDRLTEGFLATGDAAELVAKGFENDYNELKRFAGAFAQLAKEDPAAARRLLDAAEAAGASKDLIGSLEAQLDEAAAAEQQMAADTDASTDAIKGQADATGEATSALQEYSDQIRAMTDPLFGAMDAITGNRDAQLAYQDALAGVGEAQTALDEAIAAHGATSAEAQEATRALEDAERAVSDAHWATVESAAEADSALAGLKDAVNAGDVSVDAFKDTLATWVRQGFLTQQQADEAAASVSGLASQASEADKERVDIPVTTPGSERSQDQLHRTTNEALKVPTRRNTNVTTSGTGSAMFRIQQVKDKISSLQNKTVHVNVAVSGIAQLNIAKNKLLGFQHGGRVPGPVGSEQIILAHGGETILPTHNKAAMGKFIPSPLAMDAGGSTYVDNRQINVYTGADPQQVVDALKRFERRNGSVPIRVSG